MRPLDRKCLHILTAACVALAIGMGPTAHPSQRDRKPNILLIVGDDMGYADIGVHGATDIRTPHLDALAREGVRFSSAYVSGPYCSPTRAALMTGRYQQRYGHEFNPGPAANARGMVGLPLTETTLADRLKAGGYRTGMVGKWHLGSRPALHPMKRGFDEYFGFLGGAHSYLDARTEKANPILRGTEPVNEPEYLTDAFRREALAFIDRRAAGADPWFLYLAFNAVHTPMHAAPRYLDRYTHIANERRRTYAAMMSAMDDAIGAVIQKVRDLKIEEQTLILFMSDNGGPPANASSNGALRGHKASTWEGGVRVPLLIQWKGVLPAGKVYDQPVIQMDLHATALSAAGITDRQALKLDGVDLVPYVKGATRGAPHDALYWRFGPQMAIRMGDWKLVKAREARGAAAGDFERAATGADLAGAQLFNLATDMGEQIDLAAKEPDRAKALQAAWKKWNATLEEPRWIPGSRRPRR
jgi:arylsulfatase A-like enzyme